MGVQAIWRFHYYSFAVFTRNKYVKLLLFCLKCNQKQFYSTNIFQSVVLHFTNIIEQLWVCQSFVHTWHECMTTVCKKCWLVSEWPNNIPFLLLLIPVCVSVLDVVFICVCLCDTRHLSKNKAFYITTRFTINNIFCTLGVWTFKLIVHVVNNIAHCLVHVK